MASLSSAASARSLPPAAATSTMAITQAHRAFNLPFMTISPEDIRACEFFSPSPHLTFFAKETPCRIASGGPTVRDEDLREARNSTGFRDEFIVGFLHQFPSIEQKLCYD